MVNKEENKKTSKLNVIKNDDMQKKNVVTQEIEIVDKKDTLINKKNLVSVKEENKKDINFAKKEKPIVTQAVAVAKNVRLTPRKARLVIDLVRGKKVNQALDLLQNLNKKGSTPVFKVIKSAASNAVNNYNMNLNNLYVDTIYANDGIRFKRMIPKAKGSSARILKRTCHITAIVKEKK